MEMAKHQVVLWTYFVEKNKYEEKECIGNSQRLSFGD